MPTYVYRRADGTTFEVTQRISAEPLTEDPETGEPVARVISGGAGLQFKGSGFYLTDYVHPGSADRKADAKGGETGSEASAPKTAPSSGSGASESAGKTSPSATPKPPATPTPTASSRSDG